MQNHSITISYRFLLKNFGNWKLLEQYQAQLVLSILRVKLHILTYKPFSLIVIWVVLVIPKSPSCETHLLLFSRSDCTGLDMRVIWAKRNTHLRSLSNLVSESFSI